MVRYLIIGNSTAAVSAIEAIREVDKKGQITVVTEEIYPNYSRPLISYFLGGEINKNKMHFRGKEFYRTHKVNLILGKKAESLNTREKAVRVNGEIVHFDRLLIATGGVPIKPSIKGMECEGVFTFTRFSDAVSIKEYIKKNRVEKVAILGGGLIGLKACEAILLLKRKAVIVELADRILSTTFDRKASGIIEDALKRRGSEIITRNSIIEIVGEKGRVSRVILRDLRNMPVELLIIAVGVRPNIELAKGTEIATNKGIVVDEYMETSIPGIFAAGDVAEVRDFLRGVPRITAIWTEAFRQGHTAGYNMAGLKKEYKGSLPMNSVELCGIPTISVGETDPSDEDAEIMEKFDLKKLVYKKIVLRDNVISGFIFINEIERAGIYTGLIKDRINVEEFKGHLLKEDFGVISLPQEYRKHLVKGDGAVI